MAKITKIEGIGPVYEKRLAAVGINTTEALLEAGASKIGRIKLSKETGIEYARILKWTSKADLFRVKGLEGEYSELLFAVGVDTIKKLRNKRAESLYAKMSELNKVKKLVRVLPAQSLISCWIENAQELEEFEIEEISKDQILQELKEAVIELSLVEQGKMKARPVKELLDEL